MMLVTYSALPSATACIMKRSARSAAPKPSISAMPTSASVNPNSLAAKISVL